MKKVLKFYTGLQNKEVFEWIMNKIKDKILKLQYDWKIIEKKYQTLQMKKIIKLHKKSRRLVCHQKIIYF